MNCSIWLFRALASHTGLLALTALELPRRESGSLAVTVFTLPFVTKVLSHCWNSCPPPRTAPLDLVFLGVTAVTKGARTLGLICYIRMGQGQSARFPQVTQSTRTLRALRIYPSRPHGESAARSVLYVFEVNLRGTTGVSFFLVLSWI
ncbi:hypothetical protein GGR56DRAFT_145148 [Xylariaceae sp. FL0804]|nr:hypothetical protein GGR56DRAFT_145148 [Xylariaceae sp. FL0804]